jgi:hypothetical protein
MDLHIVEIFCYMTLDKQFSIQPGLEKEQPCGEESKQV